jgi:hypothetical protein
MKLTEWFPKTVSPAKNGVYERNYGGKENLGYARFYKGKWYWRALSVDGANIESFKSQTLAPWRGLAEDPKGSKK